VRQAHTASFGSLVPASISSECKVHYLPPPMQVWWGEHLGAPLGLMTDWHGIWPPGGDPVDQTLLERATVTSRVLVDERVWAATTHAAERPDPQAVSDALLRRDWRPLTVIVDDARVTSAAVSFAGLDFVVGNVGSRHPFVMARPVGSSRPWPSLVTVS
jgi:hypothetical protein